MPSLKFTQLTPVQALRVQIHKLNQLVRGRYWFPHFPLALVLALGGVLLLNAELGARWQPLLTDLLTGRPGHITPALLPPLLIGGGMLVMALGLFLRSRLAWVMALLLAATAAVSLLFSPHHGGHVLLWYFVLTLAVLMLAWRQFDHSSVTASTLFALTSVVMLLLYATFGTYYLGAEFNPPIHDLVTALYSAVVTMTTVGYGDIVPHTAEARLFVVSVILLGVAVFATSLTAVIAPMMNRSLERIVNHERHRMKRENHFVVIGASPLAANTCRELIRRGQPVTRIFRQTPGSEPDEGSDFLVGDPGSVDVLRQAGAEKATAVLAMSSDDSENAFTVLATRELGSGAKTVVAVNDAQHLSRVKLVQPDVVIAPQILGGELAAMLMCGEEVSSDFVMQRVLQQSRPSGTSGA
jgi:voltage-gated potassium channel